MTPEAPLDPVLTGVTETRLQWEKVPPGLRRSIERHLGDSVERSEIQCRGFSPALASRLTLRNGRRFFVKAIGPDAESGAPGGQDLYRQEAHIAARLPEVAPTPRLLASWEEEDWVILLFEDVEGHHPTLPWDRGELGIVLEGLSALSDGLTPSPVPAASAGIPGGRDWWSELIRDAGRLDRLLGLDPWVRANIDLLAATSRASGSPFAGSTLLHTDIRADNILLQPDRVVFVDWPHAKVGAPWVELVFFLPSVVMQGGPDPELLFWRHPSARGVARGSVLSVLAGLAGFFVYAATEDPPPGLPTLRMFQLAQGVEAVNWLRRMMG